jgi:hypothetical protein
MTETHSDGIVSPFELMSKHLEMIPRILDSIENLRGQKEPAGIPYAGSIDSVMMPITNWTKSTCYLNVSKMPPTVAVKRGKTWTIYRDNLISWMQRDEKRDRA